MTKPPCTGCGKCYFNKLRFVGGRGDPKSPLLIVGESPGGEELIRNEPFRGPSGKILNEELSKWLPGEQSYWMTNAMQCVPEKVTDALANHKHMSNAVNRCRKRLLAEIEVSPRKVIIAVGNAALWALTGRYDLKITQVRGRLIKSDLCDIGIVPTVHPAFLLRGGGGYSQKFKEDIQYACDLAKGHPPRKFVEPEWFVAETEEDVRNYHKLLKDNWQDLKELADLDPTFRLPPYNKPTVACDIETTGFRHRTDRILCAGLATDPRYVYIIPEHLIHTTAYKELMEDPEFRFCNHNWKFDLKFLRNIGINAPCDDDTMLMSYVLNENRGIHDLDAVASDVLGAPPHKKVLSKYLAKKSDSFEKVPVKVLHKYNAFDVSKTIAIFNEFYWPVNADRLNKMAYYDLYMPASDMLIDVEMNGIFVNREQVRKNAIVYRQRLKDIKAKMHELTKEFLREKEDPFNPASPQQMKELLYVRLGLGKPTESTDKDTIKLLTSRLDREKDFKNLAIVRQLTAYRQAAKIYGTYVRPLLSKSERTPAEQKKKDLKNYLQNDGRVYATFLIHGTQTGRLASRDPNLQNQPRLGDLRDQLMASPGRWLMEIDYNQAELRSLAYMSRDPELLRIYSDPDALSLHYEVSVDLWGESWLERYTDEHKEKDKDDYDLAKLQYIRTKAVNFGIVYGRTAQSLAEEFEIPISEAQIMIDGWARKFPEAWKFIEMCRSAPVTGRTLKTVYGRRKRPKFASAANMSGLQNEAANFPHQSTASDFTLDSAVQLYRPLKVQFDTRIVNLVHDAIYLDLPPDRELAHTVARYVVDVMEETPRKKGITKITFVAEPELGISWGSLHKVDKEDGTWHKYLDKLEGKANLLVDA